MIESEGWRVGVGEKWWMAEGIKEINMARRQKKEEEAMVRMSSGGGVGVGRGRGRKRQRAAAVGGQPWTGTNNHPP